MRQSQGNPSEYRPWRAASASRRRALGCYKQVSAIHDERTGIQLAADSNGVMCMRRSVLFSAAVLSISVFSASTYAQNHTDPAINSCIKEFYDPGMYNYLTFRNDCSQTLTIVFVAKDGSGATGTMELRSGASDSVGRSADGVVPKVGGFQLYVCQAGYMPVDENNKIVSKPRTKFRCQSKEEIVSGK